MFIVPDNKPSLYHQASTLHVSSAHGVCCSQSLLGPYREDNSVTMATACDESFHTSTH